MNYCVKLQYQIHKTFLIRCDLSSFTVATCDNLFKLTQENVKISYTLVK